MTTGTSGHERPPPAPRVRPNQTDGWNDPAIHPAQLVRGSALRRVAVARRLDGPPVLDPRPAARPSALPEARQHRRPPGERIRRPGGARDGVQVPDLPP